jgi:hypothetical protein
MALWPSPFRASLYLHNGSYTGLDKLRRIVIGAMVNHWWDTKVRRNTVTVKTGVDALTFHLLPDGSNPRCRAAAPRPLRRIEA